MVEGISRAIGDFIAFSIIVMILSVPLAIWKLVEIIIWLIKNVRVSVG